MMIRRFLIRGMLAGVVAALCAVVFAEIFGEPQVVSSIAFEETGSPTGEPALVSRAIQRTLGLGVGVGVYGIAVGGLFALAYSFAHGRLGSLSVRSTAAVVAMVGFMAIVVVPFVTYPATPPAVGSPETLDERTALFFGSMLLSVVLAIGAVVLARRMSPAVGAFNAVVLAVLGFIACYALVQWPFPGYSDYVAVPEDFPAEVLWNFRVASMGTQLVLWSVLGVGFGWLAERVTRRSGSDVVATASAADIQAKV